MSDSNDFENNTLPDITTTEEAFDQFQVNSASDEGDYVLLSDIVPAENIVETPEMPGSYDDGLIDGTEVSSVEYLYEPRVEAANGYDVSERVDINDLSKRLTLGNSDHDYDMRPELDQPPIQHTTPPVTEQPLPRKRGRKPKKPFGTSDTNTSLYEKPKKKLSPAPTTQSRRGRKPKISQPVVSHLDKNTNGTTTSTDISEPPKNVSHRNTRKTKHSINYSNEDQEITMTVNEELTEIDTPPPKKRGRKKKAKPEKPQKSVELTSKVTVEPDNDDDGDDISLSKLKKSIDADENKPISDAGETEVKASKNPVLDDFEYNIDNVIAETPNVVVESVAEMHASLKLNMDSITTVGIDNKSSILDTTKNPSEIETTTDTNALLVEDSSRRPQRRNARKPMHYEVDSDADPFADVSSSDNEDYRQRKRKRNRNRSDDEFDPRDAKDTSDESAHEEWDEDFEGHTTPKKKQKGGKKGKTSKLTPQKIASMKSDDDIEACLQPTVIKGTDSGSSRVEPKIEPTLKKNTMDLANKEFENFLNRRMQGSEGLKIKKVSKKETSTTTVAPLEIPTVDATKAKKMLEISTQTSTKETKSALVQTSSPYSIKMTNSIDLSSQQTENACVFLTTILKTTSELGTLMTEKSEEFIQKKVNAEYVKDTMKVDYCIKKAFLLFKLAKDNLSTMEENLEKQYEDFLKTNNLSKSIETEKKLAPKPQDTNSDSDCEIVGETTVAKPIAKNKSKFNPKTVFLNKELSIKIAKKPTEKVDEKTKKAINIKGRHAVWINDAVMVKKVKGQQSFLAQDSRNKKPPDTNNKITEEMVRSFFEEYHRAEAMRICSVYTSSHWLEVSPVVTCNYFFISKEDESDSSSSISQPLTMDETSGDTIQKLSDTSAGLGMPMIPKTLFSLCTEILRKSMRLKNIQPIPQLDMPRDGNCETEVFGTICTLFNLSLKNICRNQSLSHGLLATESLPKVESDYCIDTIESLKTLSYKKVINLLSANTANSETIMQDGEDSCETNSQIDWTFILEGVQNGPAETTSETSSQCSSTTKQYKKDFMESMIQHKNGVCKPSKVLAIKSPDTLKRIAYNNLKVLLFGDTFHHEEFTEQNMVYHVQNLSKLCFKVVTKYFDSQDSHSKKTVNTLAIGTVNTLSEEAFWNMEETSNDSQYAVEEGFCNDYEDHTELREDIEPDNWESQVQMQELKSGIINSIMEPQEELESHQEPAPVQIKQEVVDDHTDCLEPVNIKTEPIEREDSHTGMVSIPSELAHIVAKGELQDYTDGLTASSEDIVAATVTAENFEEFVRNNKMMQAISYEEDAEEGHSIFSQSGARVRRQFVPDSYNNYEIDMDLLVPQQAEPLTSIVAKDTLMESSSDDDNVRQKSDKKPDKKKRKKPKKNSNVPNSAKNLVSIPSAVEKVDKKKEKAIPAAKQIEKPVLTSEIAILTRRMKERIQNEVNKGDSSNSDNEELTAIAEKITSKKKRSKNSKVVEEEIQCSNVDSTEQVSEKNDRTPSADLEDSFTGFSAVDQNDIDEYQKYLNNVYQKILPGKTKDRQQNSRVSSPSTESKRSSPLIMRDDPVELLECEPTMPIFEYPKPRSKKKEGKTMKVDKPTDSNYVERHGWKCYSADGKDAKLYHLIPYVGLDKLPEIFVETYFQYLNVTEKSKEDAEVDRLTNLQSLHKQKQLSKDLKNKTRTKEKSDGQQSEQIVEGESELASPDHSDYNELAPSDDEVPSLEDEIPPPVALKPSTDNSLAKNLLMHENDSDTETASETSNPPKPRMRGRAAEVKVFATPDALVLTADKMMKKELAILHAPVLPDDEKFEYEPKEDKYTPPKDSSGKHKKRSLRYKSRRERANPEDSSSEEEKQWVSTKEKLLKRMEKKIQESTSVDDAKRTKILNEFIEKRGDSKVVPVKRGRGRRSKKKFLERQKQLKVLSNELYGDSAAYAGKKSGTAYSKGRRNIRKVIDKKSLARSTVIANMEEFERKKRLCMKQNRLRELLGYEEGVNVLVINDEVCLEYDFEELQPVVTVHPFFTKVMKAHQYEGVKFMWDACFESLEMVESGSGGGGCILAHCMGLGKTLQVLALLHTVLTHPRVRMQRVLVCCPLSTVLNWVDEIHKWLGPVTDQIKVFELSKLKKTYERAYQLEDWYNGGGIFIIGYELFRSLSTLDPALDDVRPTIIKKIRSALLDPGPDIIVCDEGHLLKNDTSVLAIAMSRVKTKRRIILTGTPMQNNLREYYCMVDFVKPNLLGTYFEYSNRFENPIMNGQHRDSREEDIKLMKARTHILHKVLEGCLQRQEASVLYPYLPKKHEYTVFISLTKCQSDLYRHYLSGCKTHPNSTNKSSLLKDYNILQKIWSHPRVLHNFQTRQRDEKAFKVERLEDDLARDDLTASVDVKPACADVKPGTGDVWWLDHMDGGNALESLESSNKFVTVFKILKECVELGDKLLIFSTSLFTMDALEYFLKMINGWSLGQEYYRLDGSVPPEVRQKWCREFNAEHNVKTKLFLISTRAGSLGLNMTAANRVIILDTSWNPAHDIQSIFRVYRFGQKKDCYIYRLVAMGTMEQKIYERAVTKQAVACRVVDEQQIDRHYNMGELAELYRLDEQGEGVACGVAVGVRDVVLLRVARDTRALHAVHEHDSLLRDTRDELPEHERAAAWQQFQQEQQMQDRLTALPPKTSLLKAPAKRTYGQQEPHLYPQQQQPIPAIGWNTPTVKVENEYESQQKTELKMKKGRKNSMITCDIPVRKPSTAPPRVASPVTILPDSADPQSQDIIAKITAALQKHNFKSSDGAIQPAVLAKMVSSIVSNVNVEVMTGNKEQDLASSLATAMNQDAAPQESEPPPPQDTNKSRGGRPKKKRRGRPRKDNAAHTVETEDFLTPRTKRQAAITAELKIETGKESPSVINLDDDSDAEYFPDECHNDSDPETGTPKGPAKPKVEPKASSSKSATKPAPAGTAINESILLSDDEAPKKSNSTEVVPLHISLLTNPNFVKIVAHTYLKGNPMMDEDAASLAAEYSTSKALKEVESMGKSSIDSGPIYEIAKETLGVAVLKKLYNAKSSESTPQKADAADTKKGIKVAPLSKMKGSQGKVVKLTPKSLSKMLTPPEEKKKAAPLKITIRSSHVLKPMDVVNALKRETPEGSVGGVSGVSVKRDATGSNPGLVFTQPPAATRNTSGVVPVGLIQRVENTTHTDTFSQNDEESILPDDDEVHFVNTAAAAPAAAPALTPLPNSLIPANVLDILARKRANNSLKDDKVKQNNLGEQTQPTNVTPLKQVHSVPPNAKIIRLQKIAPKAAAAPQPAGTICLDSDEEDAPSIVSGPIPAAPTPVSLHSSTPSRPHLRSLILPQPHAAQPPLPQQLLTKQQLVQQQLAQQQQQTAQQQIIQQQLLQQQIAQQQMGQQRPSMPQMIQLNVQGQKSNLTLDQLGHQFQTMFGAKNIVLVPASAWAGGDVNVVRSADIPATNGAVNVMTQPSTAVNLTDSTVPDKPPPSEGPKVYTRNSRRKQQLKPTIETDKQSPPSPKPAKILSEYRAPEPASHKPAAPTKRSYLSRVVSSSSSSESERSRSPSPSETMSLFKNVVHIQAPTTELVHAKPGPASKKVTATATTNSKTPGPKSKTLAPTKSQNKPGPTEKNADLAPSKIKGKPMSAKPTSAKPNLNVNPSKPLRLLASFDLTEPTPSETKKSIKSSNKPVKILNSMLDNSSTITGTSKNIIIGGANKTLSKVNTTKNKSDPQSPGSRVVHITNMKTLSAPVAKPQSDAKRKAAAPAPAPAPESKKPKKPMRLEDFSIDDIEDIIELE